MEPSHSLRFSNFEIEKIVRACKEINSAKLDLCRYMRYGR